MKKQIAILMAAATAVTTVAPVIASADVNEHKSAKETIVDAAKKALDTKYADAKADGFNLSNVDPLAKEYLNSRYVVLVSKNTKGYFKTVKDSAYGKIATFEAEVAPGQPAIDNTNTKWFVVDDISNLSNELEADLAAGAKVAIVDKGIKDNSNVQVFSKIHTIEGVIADGNTDTEVSLAKLADDMVKSVKAVTYVERLEVTYKGAATATVLVDAKVKKDDVAPAKVVTKLKLKLTGGKEITLRANEVAPDLTKAFDAANNEIDLTAANTQATLDSVDHFADKNNKDDKTVTVDIPNGDTELYRLNDVAEKTIEIGNIYTREDGYSQKGADFVNSIIGAKVKPYKFNYDGTTYVLETKNASDIKLNKAKIDKVGDKYVLNFDVKVKDANDTDRKMVLRFAIEGKSQKDLADVLEDLKLNPPSAVVAGHFTKLAGDDRYATAVEVSAEQFKPDTADSVVIVGGKAQLDGLAAAPLAAAKNAPVLLASPNSGLNADTIKEIKRAAKSLKNQTVYIVGGKASVPESVEKQLQDEFGAVVVRLSGEDRQETSLEVARRLNYDKKADKSMAFIVGANGAADAMSISAVAATKNSGKVNPIIVASKNEIKKSTRDFLKKDLKVTGLKLIGGEGSISTQVLKDAQSVVAGTTRIAGADRYQTNARIIDMYYGTKATEINPLGIVFASGKEAYLVDAQTSGAFAAKIAAPIVLTGDKLSSDQLDLIKTGGKLAKIKAGVYQVGGVVSADVMKTVVNELGL